jgi:hypothetical protein
MDDFVQQGESITDTIWKVQRNLELLSLPHYQGKQSEEDWSHSGNRGKWRWGGDRWGWRLLLAMAEMLVMVAVCAAGGAYCNLRRGTRGSLKGKYLCCRQI